MDVEIDIEDKNIKSGFKLNPSLLSWSNFDKNISIKLEFRKSRWPRQNYLYPNTTLGLKCTFSEKNTLNRIILPSPAELITQSGLVQVYLRSETLCWVANVMVVKNPDVMSESEQKMQKAQLFEYHLQEVNLFIIEIHRNQRTQAFDVF